MGLEYSITALRYVVASSGLAPSDYYTSFCRVEDGYI